jgi:hypothetical protein
MLDSHHRSSPVGRGVGGEGSTPSDSIITAATPHPARFARHPLPRAGEGFFGAENPFSRLREKVAGDSRPDEGPRHDSFKNILQCSAALKGSFTSGMVANSTL